MRYVLLKYSHMVHFFKFTLSKRYKILFFILFILVPNIFSEEKDSVNYYLYGLDGQLLYKNTYELLKQKKIQALRKDLLSASDGEKRYQLYCSLFDEYQSYNYDSAFVCVNRMIEIASSLHDTSKLTDARLMAAYSCTSAGLFLEAKEFLQAIDSTSQDIAHKVGLYSGYSKLYLDMALSIRHDPYEKYYYDQSIKYSRQIIAVKGEEDPLGMLQQINIYRCRKQYDKAIEVTRRFLHSVKVNERSRTLCFGGMGMFYLFSGDTIQATTNLAKAAIGELRSATKESSALSDLANIAYKRGDIERAYSYIKQSMDNASFYNARHRKVEAGGILPIIEASRFEMLQQQRNKLYVSLAFVTFLFLCFLGAMVFILKQMRQLKKARKLIQLQNIDLKDTNRRLKDSSKLKDEYIGYFFSLNSAFMDEIEDFRKLVSRKLTGRQYNELMQIVKQMDSSEVKAGKYVSFDSIFLKLFPDFVEHFNQLFSEEDRIVLQNPHSLTTELRIFALTRLGVGDSEHIAKFLNYSVNTINTYKTKVKNRSLVPNHLFEQKIMEIETVKSDFE